MFQLTSLSNKFLLNYVSFPVDIFDSACGRFSIGLGNQNLLHQYKGWRQGKKPFLIQFGLSSQMGIAPALVDWPDTGHHHLIIDSPTPDPNKAIPSKSENHIHLSGGQTEWKVDLPPGKHTLQLILGDYSHIPHDPPVLSEVITIIVE